jgi:hypothetical protein
MRSFLLLTSLLALVLGFAGTALGVRPRPVVADSAVAAERIDELELRVTVLTRALDALEDRFEEHRARSPALPATEDPGEEPAPKVQAPDAEASRPAPVSPVLLAALERAEDHVEAGDSRGARELLREILARDDLPPAIRVRARLDVVAAWEILEAWPEARYELRALSADLESLGAEAPPDALRDVRVRLERLPAGGSGRE